MVVVVEDMGYGIVYLGLLCNDVVWVCEILNLFDYMFLLFGMVVGEFFDEENGLFKLCLLFKYIFYKD